MKNISTLLVLGALLAIGSGCCASTKAIITPQTTDEVNEEAVNKMQDSTVALVRGSKGEREAYCGGVWIEHDTILTAAHCVEMEGRSILETPPWEEYNPIGDIIAFMNYSDIDNEENVWIGVVNQHDKNRDLATLQVLGNSSKHSIAKILKKDVNSGKILHVMGHPAGIVWTYTRGYVAKIRKVNVADESNVKVVQVSAPIWFGNSGGGAFDSDGNLVAICSLINTRAPNISFFIHKDEILEFLAKRKSSH